MEFVDWWIGHVVLAFKLGEGSVMRYIAKAVCQALPEATSKTNKGWVE